MKRASRLRHRVTCRLCSGRPSGQEALLPYGKFQVAEMQPHSEIVLKIGSR